MRWGRPAYIQYEPGQIEMSIGNVEERKVVRLAHSRTELQMIGSDLMRGHGLRVVSAWRHIVSAGKGLLAHEKLFDLIVRGIQSNRAGYYHWEQPQIAAWVCRPYVNLALSYGRSTGPCWRCASSCGRWVRTRPSRRKCGSANCGRTGTRRSSIAGRRGTPPTDLRSERRRLQTLEEIRGCHFRQPSDTAG